VPRADEQVAPPGRFVGSAARRLDKDRSRGVSAPRERRGAGAAARGVKRTAVALKQADIAFALGGGYAAWARGGPEPEHDVDFLVAETDAERAERALTKADLRVEHPPEDWLFKVFTDDAMVDLVFRVSGVPVESPILERAEEFEALSVRMPVLEATDPRLGIVSGTTPVLG